MEQYLPKPNMVILKFDQELVSFPLDETGLISSGTSFESDYDIEEHNIILALYDHIDYSSKELYRFSYVIDSVEQKTKTLYERNELQSFIKELIEYHLTN